MLHVSYRGSTEGTIISKEIVIDGVDLDLRFCFKHPDVEERVISVVSDINACVSVFEGICLHSRNIRLNRVGALPLDKLHIALWISSKVGNVSSALLTGTCGS